MEAKYRAQIIILKKSLNEKKETIKKLHEKPLLSFLDSLQIATDFANSPFDEVLKGLYQFLNSFQRDLNQEITEIQSTKEFTPEVIKILMQRFKSVQVIIYNYSMKPYELFTRFLNTLIGLRNILIVESVKEESIQRYTALLACLIVEIINSLSGFPTVNEFKFSRPAGIRQCATGYPLIRALLAPRHHGSLKEFKDIETQTDQDEPATCTLDVYQAEEKKSIASIRLHQYSSTIQELRSKLPAKY
jgi:hypothetical protein